MRKIVALLLILLVALNVVLIVSSLDGKDANKQEGMLSNSFKVEVKDVSALFFSGLVKF